MILKIVKKVIFGAILSHVPQFSGKIISIKNWDSPFWCFYFGTYFTNCSGVSIADSEQVNAK